MQQVWAADAIGQPPADLARPLANELARQRLIDVLADRWIVKLVQVEAPGGFGKSIAIVQAIRDNLLDPTGRDVYVRVAPTDHDLAGLTARISTALGHAAGDPEATADLQAAEICHQIGTFAPTPITLILDDVHHIAARPEAVDFVQNLLAHLPTNGHLLLSGRSLPELALARLRANDDVIDIRQTDLAFTADETESLAEAHGPGVTDLDLVELGGWPALIRLALVAGSTGPTDFVAEEVVNQMHPTSRLGTAAAAIAGFADDELLDRLGISVSATQLASTVPLVDELEDGRVRTHDLWSEMVGLLAEPSMLTDYASTIAEWHVEASRYDQAIALAAQYELWPNARDAVMSALAISDVKVSARSTEGWMNLFPADQHDEPELRFLRGWHARLQHGPGHGRDDVKHAMLSFAERGDVLGEARTAFEYGFQGWLAGELEPVLDALERAHRLLEEEDAEFLRGFADAPRLVTADLGGDFRQARSIVLSERDEGTLHELLVLRYEHLAALAFLLGDLDAANQHIDRLIELEDSSLARISQDYYRFQAGEIDAVASGWLERRYPKVENVRNDLTAAYYSCVVDAALGIVPELSNVEEASWERGREHIVVSSCRLLHGIVTGDPDSAATFAADVERSDLDPQALHAELRRFFALAYVSLPAFRSLTEATTEADDFATTGREPLGSDHVVIRDLARIVVALRDETTVDWSGYPGPDRTIGSLPLPWSIVVVAGLTEHDADMANALVDRLVTVAGTAATTELRRLADSDEPTAPSAQKLLTQIPSAPSVPLHISTQGDITLQHGQAADTMRRKRLRELLSVLILRRSIERDSLATLLWGDRDPLASKRNLATNLTYLRNELEPDRQTNEPPYFLRQQGTRLQLLPRPGLSIDLWELLAAAETVESGSHHDRRQLVQALSKWTGPILPDIRDHLELGPELTEIERRLQQSALAVSERCLAAAEFEDALRLADQVRQHDSFNERAHRCRIAALAGLGRGPEALAAITQTQTMLRDLGVEPSAETQMLVRQVSAGFERGV
jgi:ATP/maltotriose-dependent transcriptional regulator MalT